MTATDKDGGNSTAVTKTVTVGGVKIVTSTCGSGTDLVVGGTSAGDTIKVPRTVPRGRGALRAGVVACLPPVHI
jgi:hypothetical protein